MHGCIVFCSDNGETLADDSVPFTLKSRGHSVDVEMTMFLLGLSPYSTHTGFLYCDAHAARREVGEGR